MSEQVDWYERRDELDPEQIFRMYDGSVVKLDHRKPGDGSRWVVAGWHKGWTYDENTIEPGDLEERLPDDWSDGLIHLSVVLAASHAEIHYQMWAKSDEDATKEALERYPTAKVLRIEHFKH